MNMTIDDYTDLCKQKMCEYKSEGMSVSEAFKRLNEHLKVKNLPTNKFSRVRNYYY